MIPLDFFTELSKACADRPFALLSDQDQKRYFGELKKVEHLDSFAEKFRAQVDEFYFAEARVHEACRGLTPDKIEANDLKVLETTGAFYIWEYTLILGQEMLKRSDEEKWKLLKDGLSVPAGNLPSLIPLMKSFRQELAFKLYNRARRWQVLRIFFDFQAALDTNDLPTILKGLRKFHIDLLTLARDAGLKTFTGFIYKPYPDGTSYETILKDLQK